jgi:GNAT superfamily N-acetyltransferase
LVAAPHLGHRARIAAPLDAFNDGVVGAEDERPLALLLHDAGGEVTGGLWGRSVYRWLFIELLFVPAEIRGLGVGSDLLRQAEAEALRRGCHGVWLDSFSFQAPRFYERHGYRAFGQVEDYPPGHTRFFLKKRLVP